MKKFILFVTVIILAMTCCACAGIEEDPTKLTSDPNATAAIGITTDESLTSIETDIVTLYYPSTWEGKVATSVEDGNVYFTMDGAKLFDVLFAETEDAYMLGTYGETPVYIVSYNFEDSGLAEDKKSDYCTAQEEIVNVMINKLSETGEFVLG